MNTDKTPLRIKICGLTRVDDARAAAEAGVDAIGLVFAESTRRVTLEQAALIAAALPPAVEAVGVFANAELDVIRRAVDRVGLGEVQLHGEESPEFAERLSGTRVVKAIRVRDATFVDAIADYRGAGVAAILLDAYSREARGGTGERFDWDLIVAARAEGSLDDAPPFILAGGLTPHNIAEAIRHLHPWGVDVSSGVELQPGIKCPEKIARLIAAACSA